MARQTLSLMALTPVDLSKPAGKTSLVKSTAAIDLGDYYTSAQGRCKGPTGQ